MAQSDDVNHEQSLAQTEIDLASPMKFSGARFPDLGMLSGQSRKWFDELIQFHLDAQTATGDRLQELKTKYEQCLRSFAGQFPVVNRDGAAQPDSLHVWRLTVAYEALGLHFQAPPKRRGNTLSR